MTKLCVVYCVHCGRVYIINDRGTTRGDRCECEAELYPVSRHVVLGEELRGGDGTEIRACIGKCPDQVCPEHKLRSGINKLIGRDHSHIEDLLDDLRALLKEVDSEPECSKKQGQTED